MVIRRVLWCAQTFATVGSAGSLSGSLRRSGAAALVRKTGLVEREEPAPLREVQHRAVERREARAKVVAEALLEAEARAVRGKAEVLQVLASRVQHRVERAERVARQAALELVLVEKEEEVANAPRFASKRGTAVTAPA